VDRLEETSRKLVTAAIMNGSQVVRVHDVKAMKRVVAVADAIVRALGMIVGQGLTWLCRTPEENPRKVG